MQETEIVGEDVGHAPCAEITAAEALELIREGKLLRNATVRDRLKLCGEFPLPVRMRNVRIANLETSKATFLGQVDLSACTLVRPCFGKGTNFTQGLKLEGCKLRNPRFRNVTTAGLRLDKTLCTGAFLMEGCRVEGDARMWDARFEGWLEIRYCEFLGVADFRSFRAEEGAVVTNDRFHGDALWRGCSIAKKLDLKDSRFAGLIDFSKAKLHDFAYLESIQLDEGARFAFVNAIADRILIGRPQLERRLASEHAGDHASAAQELGLLKRNFEGLHRYDDEDWAFYRFKVNRRRAKPTSWLRPWTKLARFLELAFLDYGCGYGVNPFRAIASAAVLMTAFAAIYAGGIDAFSVERPPFADQPLDSLANRVAYGLVTSISVFTAGFTGDHLTTTHGWMLAPVALEALVGTLLWGLFIVAFSRKVIR